MQLRKYISVAIFTALLTGASLAKAALAPIDVTWNPSGAGISTQGPFTFDDVILNTYSNIDITGNTFTEQGFMKLSVFTNNAFPTAMPTAGFPSGTPYSLYISFSAAGNQTSVIPGSIVPAFGQFTSLSYSLLGAPGLTTFHDSNSDGVFEVSGAAPTLLATGSLLSPGSTALTVDPATGLLLPAAQLTATFVPNPAFAAFFVTPNALTGLTVTAAATNSGTLVNLFPLANGTRLSLDGGGGNVTLALTIPEPEVYGMLLAGLGLLGFWIRRKAIHETV